jgi:acetylornithine deacetylase/succinyl-diaminopimelate desuccinylase-like protein
METIERYLQKNQERFVDELCEYVRFPSVSAQPQHRKDLQACAEWLCEHCRHIGLEANLHPTDGNPVLIAKTPGQSKGAGKAKGKPHFVVYGHYDVQPPEPLELATF